MHQEFSIKSFFSSFWQFFKICYQDDQSRRILWVPVGMGAGILSYFFLSAQPSNWIISGLLVGAIIVGIFPRLRNFSGLLFFTFSLGFTVAHVRTWMMPVQMIDQPIKNFSFTGIVDDHEITPYGPRLILSLKEKGALSSSFSKIRLTIKEGEPPPIGSQIKGEATLLPFGNMMGGYNFRRAAYFQGLSATGQLHSYQEIDTVSSSFLRYLKVVRQAVNQIIINQFSSDAAAGSIVSALITGIRAEIPSSLRQAFTDAGLAHVLAISGLHLSLIAGFVFLLIRRGLSLSMALAERYPLKKVAAILTIPLLFFYLVISGVGIPALRAFLMILVGMTAICIDRNPFSMRLVCFAATVILLIYPESLLSASFQLSFAAVVALIAAYEKGTDWSKKWIITHPAVPKIFLYLGGVIATTLIASFATTPFTIAIFQRFSLQAVLGNLIAIPLTGFVIMPLIVIFLLFMPWGIEGLITPFLHLAIQMLIKVAVKVASLPGAAILLPEQSSWFLGMFTVGGLWFCLWQQRWRYLGAGIMIAAFGFLRVTADPKIVIPEQGQAIYGFDGQQAFCLGCKQSGFFDELFLRQVARHQITRYPSTTMVSIKGKTVFLTIETLRKKKLQAVCQTVHIMASPRSIAYACPQHPFIFDRKTLRENGNITLQFSGGTGISLSTACEAQGCRPWSEARCCK